MDTKDSSYKHKLLTISEGLGEEELSHMLFLCGDVIPRQEKAGILYGHELFDALEERRKLNGHLLADLLHEVGQDALIDHLELSPYSGTRPRCQLKLVRVFIKNIGMELDDKDFESLKAACDCKKEEVTDYYKLIGYLENRKKIIIKHKVDVDFLIKALRKAGLVPNERSKLHILIKDFLEEHTYEETCYRMTSNPKGVCVIINNVKFQRVHRTRHGSNCDRDLLKRLFKQFKYDVRVFNDLPSGKIMEELGKIAQEDHWRSDSFICCVLSHGSLGSVFGVDDVAVQIRDILDLFSMENCPSLAEKPKVFFLQACQGQQSQTGSLRLGSGLQVERGPMQSGVQETGGTESDASIDEAPPSPSELEPDLLLGYATPPGYKSYRDVTQGSWYINELVNSLQKMAATENILHILTQVNNDVAEKEGFEPEDNMSVKQTPCPTFTLKKNLFLANPEDTDISLS